MTMTGLYVHIPFCQKKCHYCNFVIALAGSHDSRRAFEEALHHEIEHNAGPMSETVFDTLYLGGGTPSRLESREIEWVFHELRRNFRIRPGAEITCEVNPGDVDLRKAMLLHKLGVNRVSLGAQSFHDDTLEKLNRTHRAGEIESCFRYLRDAGIQNISLDLMLSLPGESWGKVQVSIEKAVALKPEHFSLYELTIEEKTVFGEMNRQGRLELPDEDAQFEILENARMFLKKSGYIHYELLSFAKSGYESKHNQIYWANEDYLGLGPGAFSYIEGRRYRFADSYDSYLSKIQKGDWSLFEEEVLTEKKKLIESFLLALRLKAGASLDKFGGLLREFSDEIESLEERGLVVREEGYVRLTEKGKFFAETVFAELSKK